MAGAARVLGEPERTRIGHAVKCSFRWEYVSGLGCSVERMAGAARAG